MTVRIKPARRRWGSVTVWKGKYRARAGDETRTTVGIFDTSELADAALDEAYAFEQSMAKARGPGASLLGFGRAWLDTMEREGERRGIDAERDRFEGHIATAPFAAWPVASISQRDVQRWIREVGRKVAQGPRGDGTRKVSRLTVLNVLNLLRSILRTAVENEVIDVSPAAGVVVPRERRTTEPWTWLSMEEIDAVLGCAALSVRARSAFAVAIFAGMRPGELWGLRWGDVIFEGAGQIVVRHSYKDATKGGRVRRIPLLLPARSWLEEWKLEEGCDPRPDALVWPGDTGGCHAKGFDAGWQGKQEKARTNKGVIRLNKATGKPFMVPRRGAREHAGIARPVRFYDLRHTCASHLVYGRHWVERGFISRPLRLEEVQQWLGHASISTTERYRHFAPGGLLDITKPATVVAP